MINPSLLHNIFSLDELGIVRWKSTGKEAGGLDAKGYRVLTLYGKKYKVHRIVFAMSKGVWPVHGLDHINGIKNDNRIENLREATVTQNQYNVGTSKANTTGIKGVTFYKRTGKWRASIRAFNKLLHLGYFNSAQEAALKRAAAEKSLFKDFRRSL
jgi:HNH endonuclease/AP2 domain